MKMDFNGDQVISMAELKNAMAKEGYDFATIDENVA